MAKVRRSEGAGRRIGSASDRSKLVSLARSPLSPSAEAGSEWATDILAACEAKPAKDVRDNLAVVVNEARYQGKCTIITQHGKLAAAVVPIEDLSEMLRLKKRSAPTNPAVLKEETGTLDDLHRNVRGGKGNNDRRESGRPTLPRTQI